MDAATLAILVCVLAVAVAIPLVMRRGQLEAAQRLQSGQDALAGRLAQLAEQGAAAQAALARTFEERLAEVGRRVGDTLERNATATLTTMGDVKTRLAVIDEAQRKISQLSTQMVGLQDILSNKQARGAFGEVQLHDLVVAALPPSAYRFQAGLSNGKRADCLLLLPNPPGPIAIDAKFPLESYQLLRAATDDVARHAATRAFDGDVRKHIQDIAGRYIVPGETAESALMFLPSEAIYAELHANFAGVLEESYRRRVWIVSPTTLMATLNTVRAVLKDVQMREQAHLIQAEVGRLLEDVRRLDDRAGKLERHFGNVGEDLREIRISTEKIVKRGERIEQVDLGEALPPPVAPPRLRVADAS